MEIETDRAGNAYKISLQLKRQQQKEQNTNVSRRPRGRHEIEFHDKSNLCVFTLCYAVFHGNRMPSTDAELTNPGAGRMGLNSMLTKKAYNLVSGEHNNANHELHCFQGTAHTHNTAPRIFEIFMQICNENFMMSAAKLFRSGLTSSSTSTRGFIFCS